MSRHWRASDYSSYVSIEPADKEKNSIMELCAKNEIMRAHSYGKRAQTEALVDKIAMDKRTLESEGTHLAVFPLNMQTKRNN